MVEKENYACLPFLLVASCFLLLREALWPDPPAPTIKSLIMVLAPAAPLTPTPLITPFKEP
jgi:hypothetical protein